MKAADLLPAQAGSMAGLMDGGEVLREREQVLREGEEVLRVWGTEQEGTHHEAIYQKYLPDN